MRTFHVNILSPLPEPKYWRKTNLKEIRSYRTFIFVKSLAVTRDRSWISHILPTFSIQYCKLKIIRIQMKLIHIQKKWSFLPSQMKKHLKFHQIHTLNQTLKMKRNWIYQSKQQLRGFSEGDFTDRGILLWVRLCLCNK